MGKLIITSNRLPVTVAAVDDRLVLKASTGGLATGLAGLAGANEAVWVGWHGYTDPLEKHVETRLVGELYERRLYPVRLTKDEIHGYYNEFANGALWPLYHYQIERMPITLSGWQKYREVNERFADEIASLYEDGDIVWIHDYHLQILPGLLRERIPDARIGFFLHVPFPSSEIFRVLPWRTQILEGLIGADIIGFHTHAYARHFRSALLRILGIDAYADNIAVDGRTIKIGAFPLGVDVSQIALANDDVDCEMATSLQRMKIEGHARHVMLAIDRLDYTKGLPRRIAAVERLLEEHPKLRGQVVLVQIAAPSRDDVPAYDLNRRDVEGLVGRVNGRFGMPGYQPIHYVSRAFSQAEILSLYQHVDVMIVTPLRDGMHLVAKEFVAARSDLDGVLVLSEFGGAAVELGEAVQVNPYDIADTAAGMLAAIEMAPDERRARMKALRDRVVQFDASVWAKKFIEFFHGDDDADSPLDQYMTPPDLVAKLPEAEHIVLFVDYDGTLFPIVRVPQLAVPDRALLMLLKYVATSGAFEIHVVSGRASTMLDKWFGGLPAVHLHAEHGAMSRAAGESAWTTASPRSDGPDWRPFVKSVLGDFTGSTPGSFIEEKTHSIAWHYRMADPQHADRVANEFRLHARETFAPMGLEIVSGKRVIEIRSAGIHKGMVVKRVMEGRGPESIAIAMGDDATDEDMFAAVVPIGGISVAVGDNTSRAQYRLRDPAAVRRFLELLAAEWRKHAR